MTVSHKTPPSFGIRSVAFSHSARSAAFVSPFSGATQIGQLSGAAWRAEYELPVMNQADAASWKGFLLSLRGRGEAFYGWDPSWSGYIGLGNFTSEPSAPTADTTAITADSGVVTADAWSGDITSPGAPYVTLSGQSGTVLKTAGWIPGLIIYPGDYVSFDFTDATGETLRALHMVVTQRTAGDDGRANLEIEPAIRVAPAASASLITTRPSCSMRLADDGGAVWSVDENLWHKISFSAEQVLTGSPS